MKSILSKLVLMINLYKITSCSLLVNKDLKMKDLKLDKKELEILKDVEEDKYISLKQTDKGAFESKKADFEAIANNTIETITKKKAYTLKLFENDIDKIKAMALEKGLPYQTFIASILHQVANKQISV